MSRSLRIGETQTQSVLDQLLPAVARALGNNASSDDGLNALMGALQKGNHQRYFDNPQVLGHSNSLYHGNNILGHLFGSTDVSINIATSGLANTGIGSDVSKKCCP